MLAVKPRSFLLRARYVALLLPVFAVVSSVQTGCRTANDADDFAQEDRGGGAYGGGYDSDVYGGGSGGDVGYGD